MRVGDRVLYYITGRAAFAATVTICLQPMYEDHTPIWRSARRDEDYPWRVHIRQDLVLEDVEWIPAKELAYRLDYVRKWPPEHWTLAFQGHIHALPRNDFAIVEDEGDALAPAEGDHSPGSLGRAIRWLYRFHFQDEH